MEKNKLEERKKRGKKIIQILSKEFPNAKIALNYSNNWELFVAVVLSAQCTDKRVNMVTKDLFKKYKTLDDYVGTSCEEFEQDIRSTGFYRNKAKNILAAAKKLKIDFGGVVPRNMQDILTLPGAARKTANVVLSNAYNINEGIAIDTHVKRFAQRFDLSDYKDPVRIEKDFMEIFPIEEWNKITYLLIEYGRHICPARPHKCSTHPLTKIYPKAGALWPKSK